MIKNQKCVLKFCYQLFANAHKFFLLGYSLMARDQPNSRKKMHDFTVEFLKCVKFHGKFTEKVSQIHGKFTGPTDVTSRCCAIANEEISE